MRGKPLHLPRQNTIRTKEIECNNLTGNRFDNDHRTQRNHKAWNPTSAIPHHHRMLPMSSKSQIWVPLCELRKVCLGNATQRSRCITPHCSRGQDTDPIQHEVTVPGLLLANVYQKIILQLISLKMNKLISTCAYILKMIQWLYFPLKISVEVMKCNTLTQYIYC